MVEIFRNRYREHAIILDQPEADFVLHTDSALLQRVQGNMIRNALEASRPEEEIRVACHPSLVSHQSKL